MVFSSLEFLALFLPTFFLVYALAPRRARNTVLLLASWLFYGWWSVEFLFLLIGLIVAAWTGGMILERLAEPRWRKAWLATLLVLMGSTLGWYKYANLLAATLVGPWWPLATGLPLEWERVLLPIGLSFVILQIISYLVDVHRGTVAADRGFISFAAYVSMFGQLIAGPIIRYEWVARDLRDRRLTWSAFGDGARRFMIGLSMKVLVADTLSPLVDAAFALPEPTFADAWIGCGAYTLQLFFDFAGYSAMAIGIGQMMGFRFPENFNNPYLADSIRDFWRRWHLSLSTWIRDYLYIPLGGNRLGSLRTCVNLLLTMGIAGLWHGSDSWNFLIWGLAHGVALSLAHLWNQQRRYRVTPALSRVSTLLFVMLGWTLFRAADLDQALALYRGQFGLAGLGLGDVLRAELRWVHALAAATGVLAVLSPLAAARWRHTSPGGAIAALWPPLAFLLALGLVASRDQVPFLYFQF